MVAFLLLATLVVFGASIGGDDDDDGDSTVQDETNRLETQVAENPDNGDAAAVLASIYANQGNLTEAIRLYEQATTTRPDDGILWLSFGIALLRNGSFFDARIQLERALELLPESAGPAYYLGQLEQLKPESDDEAAREWYELAIETAPDSTLAAEAQSRIDEIDGMAPTPTSAP
jgi:tetratricopeptide (TPR) repeat protein